MIQIVNGINHIPGQMRGGIPVGSALDLASAGLIPPWAWAVYTAPYPPTFKPLSVTMYLENISGAYWLGLFDWAKKQFVYEQSDLEIISRPIDSAFWSIHVYAGDSVRVLRSEFEVVSL